MTPLAPPTLCSPACRMLLVAGFLEELPDGTTAPGHDVLPVVGLVAEPAPDGGAEFDALVVDTGGFGLVTCRALAALTDSEVELVAAPWPEAEDGTRLSPVVDRVKRRVVDRTHADD